ncbi:cilia- and flagella-associated protein 61 [Leucoraja erinacea]|uniref:cilia- and flagella-associated protein 61 n=1 Tax=Leucoraja erinaceus TaxID=7782 RepID=UPI0024552003|nr:cilia- and flagella-associated protein 61 [Leucoraja erinacea]XP_055494966.1 cilia- and flagella-associated protein 61 [Leucoraja erinacea]
MTSIYGTSGGSIAINVRRSESRDAPQIMKLFNQSTVNMFGRINILYLLERANLAVTVENEKNEIIAHAAFLDYPNVETVAQNNWEPWLYVYGNSLKCTPMNTIFMHLFVAKPDFAAGCAREIIRSVFNAVRELHFLIIVIEKKVSLDPSIALLFAPLPQFKKTEGVQYSVNACYRKDYVPVLHIRNARIEDHDDIAPIFNEMTDTLRTTYGEYFLAELIEAQDETNHAAVCEVNNMAVGFMSVCSEVNVDLLNSCFDLRPFHGFCKFLLVKENNSPEILEPPVNEIITPPQPEDNAERKQEEMIIQDETARESDSNVLNQPTEKARTSPVVPPHLTETDNVFCIQLFCIDEKYESRSQDFLPYIFNLYPDRDFCVITVPHVVPEFPLLKDFIRVVPYSKTTIPHELYVTHRKGLLKSIKVRLATSDDTEEIQLLVQSLELQSSILVDLYTYNQCRRDEDGTPMQVVVADVLSEIVGIAIIRNEEDIEYIRSHYNIENFIYFNHHQREEHGHLYHFALNPIFYHHTRYFLKEILRITFKSCLYYPIYPKSSRKLQSTHVHSLTSALHCLVPVRRRRQIIYPLETLGINAPSKRITKQKPKYALNHINRKLTLEPKIIINSRIVVVGASEVGISFLETLVFCPHLRFNNITLITACAIPAFHSHPSCRRFQTRSHSYEHDDYALMSLQSWVNIVVVKMIGIDRAAKHVIVTGGTKVPYEHLILCTGQQFQVPCPTGVDIRASTKDVTVDPDKQFTEQVPSNLFILNDHQECENTLHWLKKRAAKPKGNIIVYGNTIEAYITVNTILSCGIDGSLVHLVKPPSELDTSCFNNPVIETAVKEALEKANVSLYSNCLLSQWNEMKVHGRITTSSFTTDSEPLILNCAAFFNVDKKKVDIDAFKAINKACLVFDGKLVIDSTFHTNDITIRAAGPLTKYSRRYYADQWSHENFNSKEIGFQLAALMLHLFDPTLEQMTEPPLELDLLVPAYIGAKVKECALPGAYHYLLISKPGLMTCQDQRKGIPEYGRLIVTGSPSTGNYFEIHLSQYSIVDSITCLSLTHLPVSNYICLYGQHERLLNNLCSRFDEGLITDLHSYFKEPWSLCIYHDRFADFKQEVRQIVEAERLNVSAPIEDLVHQIAENELLVPEKTKAYLDRKFEQDGYKNLIERSLLNYLRYNNYHLPMFAWPGIV